MCILKTWGVIHKKRNRQCFRIIGNVFLAIKK